MCPYRAVGNDYSEMTGFYPILNYFDPLGLL